MYYLLQYGLGTSLLLFYIAIFLIQHKTPRRIFWHKTAAISAIAVTTVIGLALIALVQVVHGGDREAAGITSSYPAIYTISHRIAAAVSFLWMFYQGWLGYTKKLQRHRALAFYFIVLYTLVFISGLVLFSPV